MQETVQSSQGSIETNLDRLHGSAFDMSSGFMAVPLDADSKQYLRLPLPSRYIRTRSFLSGGLIHQRSMLDSSIYCIHYAPRLHIGLPWTTSYSIPRKQVESIWSN